MLIYDECEVFGMVMLDGCLFEVKVVYGMGCYMCCKIGLIGCVGVYEVLFIIESI